MIGGFGREVLVGFLDVDFSLDFRCWFECWQISVRVFECWQVDYDFDVGLIHFSLSDSDPTLSVNIPEIGQTS